MQTIEDCREFLEEIMQDLSITSMTYMKIYTFLGGVPKKRKPIAVSQAPSSSDFYGSCIVICDDGTIWMKQFGAGDVWENFGDIPQDEE